MTATGDVKRPFRGELYGIAQTSKNRAGASSGYIVILEDKPCPSP